MRTMVPRMDALVCKLHTQYIRASTCISHFRDSLCFYCYKPWQPFLGSNVFVSVATRFCMRISFPSCKLTYRSSGSDKLPTVLALPM